MVRARKVIKLALLTNIHEANLNSMMYNLINDYRFYYKFSSHDCIIKNNYYVTY